MKYVGSPIAIMRKTKLPQAHGDMPLFFASSPTKIPAINPIIIPVAISIRFSYIINLHYSFRKNKAFRFRPVFLVTSLHFYNLFFIIHEICQELSK